MTYADAALAAECDELRARIADLLDAVDAADAAEAAEVAAAATADDAAEAAEDVINVDVSDLAAAGEVRAALLLLRLIERLRRLVAHEYGLAPARLLPASAFVARLRAAPAGAAEEGAGVGVAHADESSYGAYHYSAVLHLHSAGDGFAGGDFVFTDAPAAPYDARAPRRLTRLAPRRGRALLFSSGWENCHYVEPCAAGARFALPAFFECVAPDAAGAAPPVDVGRAIAAELCAQWSAMGDEQGYSSGEVGQRG